jgi:3-deoxy-D-manno-octulosonic acid (KDO) 8-phosphate synthase
MKIAYGIASGLAIVMILSTLICGLWIKTHPDPSSAQFHGTLAIATCIITLIALILGFIK